MDQAALDRKPPATDAATPAKKRSLLRRILVGLAAMVVTMTCVFLPGYYGLPFALSVAVISVMAVSEFYSAVRKQGAEPSEGLGIFACILFQIAAWRREGNPLDPYLPALLTLVVLVTMLVELVKPKHKPILNIGATLLGAIYCGWLFSFLVLIHGLTTVAKAPIAGTTAGEWLVAFVIGVTSANDSGGLFVGNWLGRNKLAPSISPSKTWEGAFGGMVLAMLAAAGLGLWIHLPIGEALTMGAVFAAVGLVGDLCESALKRDLGVKDFGVILPGHGGILDRIDSVIFTAPVAYYILVFMLGPHR
jgi:phosphatidate cytidylyltransferase